MAKPAPAASGRGVRAPGGGPLEGVGPLVDEFLRAALALAEAVAAAEELGHDPPRVGSLRETVTVLPVGGHRVVVRAERRGRAGGRRLPPDVEGGGAPDL